jgi:hypothetical protein
VLLRPVAAGTELSHERTQGVSSQTGDVRVVVNLEGGARPMAGEPGT